jgi:hypothetical protein
MRRGQASGAGLLWRVNGNLGLPCQTRLADGSYLSTLYSGATERRRHNGVWVRVIE